MLSKRTLLLSFSLVALLSSCGGDESNPVPTHSISTISPTAGPKDTEITISGTGFSATAAQNKVAFNGVEATVKMATPTELVVIVPAKAKDGAVTVTIAGKAVAGPVFDHLETYTVSTFAGQSAYGHEDGTTTTASFNGPHGLALDADGNLYVADRWNYRIRKITPAGVVSTFAGNSPGYLEGTGTAASFARLAGMVTDKNGNLYVADLGNHCIRKITPAGVVSTFAGNGTAGLADGTGNIARFNEPAELAIDAAGNLYVADSKNHRIRKITPTGTVSTLAGSGTTGGFADGTLADARFNEPTGVALDSKGNIYVADYYNHRIRKITPAGVVSTLAGNGNSGGADGTAGNATFSLPYSLAFDAQDNLFVSAEANHRIRKVTSEGTVTTVAGSTNSFGDGINTNSGFSFPKGLVVNAQGDLYMADSGNDRIRKITIE